MAKRKRRKNTDFTGPGIGIFICPTSTPTSSTDVTVPSEKVLYFNLPIQKPIPSTRNIGIEG